MAAWKWLLKNGFGSPGSISADVCKAFLRTRGRIPMADFAMQNAALHFGDDLGYVHPSMQEVIEASLINYCYFYAFMYHRKRLKAFHDNRRVIGEVIGEVVSRYVPEEKMTGERFCDLSLLHGSLCLSFAGPDTYYVTSPEDFGDVFGFGQH